MTIGTKMINNWIEQTKYFGLDYSSAKAVVGEYSFDIRYDCDGVYDRKEKRFRVDKQPNYGVCVMAYFKKRQFYSAFAKDIDTAKMLCEQWLHTEVLNYYRKYCVMVSEAELRGTSN